MRAACSPTETTNRLRRYARHLVLPELGEEGQQKLLASSALVIGAGGLGSAALAYLAAGGVGRLGIVEHDRVELSNLQRQLLFETADIGTPKAEAAQTRLEEINPDVAVDIFPHRLTAENAAGLIQSFTIVLDGSDNFATRFALAEACHHARIPLVSAAISGFSGQLSTFKPYLGAPHPCYRCLVPELPPREVDCAQEGIIGPLAGLMGSWQALEAMKELAGMGTSLSGHVLHIDALNAATRKTALPRNPGCVVCGQTA
ncbi:MAG: HesA/MoeB/ThiF family protein [Rickettsiales bacterium]|nr:HesA/MoeB/ThiF family protein [Rickettsiales bacterium]